MINRFPSSGVSPLSGGVTSAGAKFPLAGKPRKARQTRYRLGWILGITASVVALATGRWHAERTPIYEGSFQLLLDRAPAFENPLSVMPDVPTANGDRATEIALLDRPAQLEAALTQLESRELAPQNWPEGLSLDRVGETQIVEVRYRHPNPDVVLAMLNALGRTYLQADLQSRQTQWEQLFTYIDTQIEQLQGQKEQQQAQLQAFQNRYAIDPQIQIPQVLERLNQLTDESSQTQRQLAQQQTLYARLQQQLGVSPELAVPLSALAQSPRYQALKTQLQEVESKISRELTRFQEGSPPIQVLRDEHKHLRTQLQAEAQNILGDKFAASARPADAGEPNPVRLELTGQLIEAANNIQVLKVQLADLSTEAAEIEGRSQQFPAMMQEYANLQQALQQTTQQLEELTNQRRTLEFQARTQSPSEWEIVAEPDIPRDELDRPVPLPENGIPLPLALAGLLGLGLGVGVALGLERLDTRLHDPQEVAELTRLPLLALVPKTNFRRSSRGSYAFQAALRALWTRLQILGDRPVNSVTILAPDSGVGTSTISRHFALAVAAAGKRVLLVDGNLRRRASSGADSDRPGLSDAIVGDFNFNESIDRSPWNDNVFLLDAGNSHADPGLLLASVKIKTVAAQLLESFDFVIYDVPTLRQYPDAQLLAALTDGAIVALRLGRTRREPTMQALAQLQAGGIPILGTIANGVDEMAAIAYSCIQQNDRQTDNAEIGETQTIESQQR